MFRPIPSSRSAGRFEYQAATLGDKREIAVSVTSTVRACPSATKDGERRSGLAVKR